MPKAVKVTKKSSKKKAKAPAKVESKPKATKTKEINLNVNTKNEITEVKKSDYKDKPKNLISRIKNFKFKSQKAKRAYLGLTIGFICITIVMLILPMLPAINYSIKPPTDKVEYELPVSSPLKDKQIENPKPIPQGNRLVIPSAGVDTAIVEGSGIEVLNTNEGVLREPFGKTPLQKGNMTLAGHRYQYLPPNMTTLYYLDKLTNGDKILIFWEGQVYTYEVYTSFEVTPDQVEILSDSEIEHELTIYTCTPIYTSTHRLVVQAKLVV